MGFVVSGVILTRARLPAILANVQRKTLIYTHYVQGSDRIIRDALEAARSLCQGHAQEADLIRGMTGLDNGFAP